MEEGHLENTSYLPLSLGLIIETIGYFSLKQHFKLALLEAFEKKAFGVAFKYLLLLVA